MKDSCDDPLEDNPLRFKLFRKTELERNCPKALQCRDASRYTVRVRGYCIWSQCYHDHSYTEENKKDTEYYRQNKIGGPRVLTEEGIDYDEVFAPVARIEAIRNKKDIMLVQVYVDDIIFGSTNKSWCDEFEALMQSRFQMSSMGELTFFLGLQVKQNKGGIFISQDKYVAEILKKFDLVNVKAAITPMETKLHLPKMRKHYDVDVTPKTSHLNAVKRIFKYLKGKPHLGLWYPRESPFDLEAFSDSKSKRTIVATSTTEAEYVAAANCCGQVLWVQNQLLDYGFNFMNTKIHIDNESTICIVKNPVYHSKTKHIEIRHHFIRDCYEKKLISVEKIHTDLNVADLLTKPFDGPRFNYLVVSIGMINP
ncbi:putative ribonuclease H-like domain-containing protein [Tanacetum coccineum]